MRIPVMNRWFTRFWKAGGTTRPPARARARRAARVLGPGRRERAAPRDRRASLNAGAGAGTGKRDDEQRKVVERRHRLGRAARSPVGPPQVAAHVPPEG